MINDGSVLPLSKVHLLRDHRDLEEFGLEGFYKGDVLLLGFILALALVIVPRGPLGAGLELDGPRLRSGVIAGGGLLEKAVQLEQLIIGRTLAEGLHLKGSAIEVLLEGHFQQLT